MKSDLLVYIPSESKASKYLSIRRILGVPQFMRPILTLEDSGLKSVIIVAPLTSRRHIIKAWKHHTHNKKIIPYFVWTPAGYSVNNTVLAEIVRNSAENLTILNANLLIDSTVLEPWKNVKLKNGFHLKAVIDRGIPPLTRFTRDDLAGLKPILEEKLCTMDDIVRILLEKTRTHPASSRWSKDVLLVTAFTRKREITRYLTEKIRQSTPTWIAKNINKRISLPISVVLAKLRISPNAITIFNMLVGMGASIGAAGRTYVGLLAGAILFQLASIIDGCDGEVAKLTHRCSKFGQYIDSISDNLALAGFITGLMIHIYRVNNHTPMAFVWGGLLLTGIFIILAFMTSFLKKNTDSASFATFDKEFLQKLPESHPKWLLLFIKYFKYTIKKDFFSLLFLVFAILGILPVMFYIAIFGVWLTVGVLTYLNLAGHRKKLVIFDFDGTLVDSMEFFADIASRVIHETYGTPVEVARRQYIETSGLPFFQQLEELHPGDWRNESAAEKYEDEKVQSYFEQKVYQDAAKTLEYLEKNGIATAISSNNFQDLIERFINLSGLKPSYSLGFKGNGFYKGAPHFRFLMEQTGFSKADMVFVGDSLKDAERAINFGIDFIGKTGLFSRDEFREKYGVPVIDELYDLTRML